MFTGLIEATGRVDRVTPVAGGKRLAIATPLAASLALGESIAVSGVCLTVTAREADRFEAEISPETLAVTSLGSLAPGRLVNLERPLRADARVGGHFVLGHVDGRGAIQSLRSEGEFSWLDVDVPADLAVYCVPKGSIAIDGISLTIAALAPSRVGVQIIPFTLAHTSLAEARAGDVVNLEADVLGKYVARLVSAGAMSAAGAVSATGNDARAPVTQP